MCTTFNDRSFFYRFFYFLNAPESTSIFVVPNLAEPDLAEESLEENSQKYFGEENHLRKSPREKKCSGFHSGQSGNTEEVSPGVIGLVARLKSLMSLCF